MDRTYTVKLLINQNIQNVDSRAQAMRNVPAEKYWRLQKAIANWSLEALERWESQVKFDSKCWRL